MLQIKIFPVNPLGANCYVCWEDAGHACIVVDPGFYRADEEDMVFNFLTENGLQPDAVFLTHAHFDHAWSAASVARRCNCPVWMSAADDPILRDHSAMLDRLKLEKTVELFEYKDATDGTVIHAGGVDWRVIATPGHTPGCVCYLCEAWGVLLSGDRDVLPGHGRPTSIAREAASNPFLLPFNEPNTDWSDQDGLAIDGI